MASGRALRTAAVGMSVIPTCGVRAHAGVLAEALGEENVSCSLHWLSRSEESLPAARSDVRAWTGALARELEEADLDAVLLHYSVFAYSYRGLPLFVHPTLSALRGAGLPVIAVMHELVYPWTIGGWRGKLWALSQRALLIDVMLASRAVIATADFRVAWLESRPWLPRRPAAFAPVFSNLPPPAPRERPDRAGALVGLFGYAYEGAASALVLDAMRALLDRGVQARLRLLGAPGPASPAAEEWRAAAGARGIADALSFSGTLSPQALADALADCDALLSVNPGGPSSRKGTLAGSLASGRPVLALDGPRRWQELVEHDAIQLVQPTSAALADGLAALLADEPLREALGARGRAFAEHRMGPARTAAEVRGLLDNMGD
ncbi:MAG TPA: glycosyltransferase [Solirubrobacteraceae bacterium]|nr:glycosyltransferase [Solirubrobacteraceae bacterium]